MAFASSAKSSRPVNRKKECVCRVCDRQFLQRPIHVWTNHMDGLKRWTCSFCKVSSNELSRLKDNCAECHPSVESVTEASSDSVKQKFDVEFERCFAAQPGAGVWQRAKINVGGSDGSTMTASSSFRVMAKSPQTKRRRTLSPTSRGYINCKLCSEPVHSNASLSELEQHISTCRLGKNSARFKCSACDFTRTHRGSVDKHIIAYHKGDKRVHPIESLPDERSCFAACFPDCLHPSASTPRLTPKFSPKSRAQASRNRTSLSIDLPRTSGVSKLIEVDDGDGSAYAEDDRESDSPFLGFPASDREQEDDDSEVPSEGDCETVASNKSSLVDCKPIMM